MSKREKIIVSLMILAVLYFVYTFLGAADKQETSPTAASSPEAALNMAEELRGKLARGEFNPPPSAALLTGLENGWREERFVAASFNLSSLAAQKAREQEASLNAEEVEAAVAELAYSGFMELESRRLAVINGSEYEVGDQVGDGLVLERINAYSLLLSRGGHSVILPIMDLDPKE